MTDTPISLVDRAGLDRQRLAKIVSRGLDGADDGELFLEYCQSESFSFDDGRLKAATFDTSQGFGLRAVAGEATGYAHASEISEDAIARAGDTVRAVSRGYSGTVAGAPALTSCGPASSFRSGSRTACRSPRPRRRFPGGRHLRM